jgi:hypothetical protein
MTKNKRKLMMAFWISFLSFLLLSTATYAWMSIASSIKVSDMSMNLVTENALELAPDVDGKPGEWTAVMQMSDLLSGDAVLKPATYSAQRDAFVAPSYGLDGRPNFSNPITVLQMQNSSSALSANKSENGENYVYSFDFWVRTGAADCTVCLAAPMKVSEGVLGTGTYVVGKPIWNAGTIRHEDGGKGAQNAIRVAFRSYDESYGGKGGFVIYEPNSDSGGSYEATPSIDGTATLTSNASLILQSTSSWSEQYPVLKDNVKYTTGNFSSKDTAVFTLKAAVARRVTMYVWLEGEDKDCVNSISDAELLANIQFTAKVGSKDNEITPR